MIRICASITARTNTQVAELILKSENKGANMLEIRLDFLQEAPNLRNIRKLTSLPLIATNRIQTEGGLFKGNNQKRVDVLFTAAKEGFDYIDLELATPMIHKIIDDFKVKTKVKFIVSYHDFMSSPSIDRLNHILKEEQKVGADVCKIVFTAKTFEDNLTCLNFILKAAQLGNVICLCMGNVGIPSRLFSPLLGGFITYACVEKGREAAIGQLTIEEIKTFYKWLES